MEDKSLESLRTEILSLSKEYFAKNKKDLFIPEISKIPVSGKVLDEKDIENLIDASLDGWLTAGRFTEEFENPYLIT